MFFTATKEAPNKDLAVKDVLGASNPSRFESLARDSYKQAYSLAVRLTGNPAEAEDLVQETYIRAFRFFHRYDTGLSFTSWLYRIMSNAHIDMVRRRGKLKLTSIEMKGSDGESTWDLPDLKSSPDQGLMDNTLADPLQRGLMSMTAEFRTAVLLADVEGMAYEEVAEIMRTSVGTVRSRIHRGRKQLRAYLMKHSPAAYAHLNTGPSTLEGVR